MVEPGRIRDGLFSVSAETMVRLESASTKVVNEIMMVFSMIESRREVRKRGKRLLQWNSGDSTSL